jgi:hypothetical protein
MRLYRASYRTATVRSLNLVHRVSLEFVGSCNADESPLTLESHQGQGLGAFSDSCNFHACSLLQSQLRIYPPRLLSSAGIHSIIICRSLYASGRPAAGVAMQAERIMLLSSESMRPACFGESPDMRFHHELFHFIDYAMGFGPNRRPISDRRSTNDPEWEALNDPGFQYYSGGSLTERFSMLEANPIRPGIWSYYSMSSAEEDKAIVFSYLICRYSSLLRCAGRDKNLALKVQLIKRRLYEFDQSFDDTFWMDTERG